MLEVLLSEIKPLHDLESEALEHVAHINGIVARIDERRRMDVGGIADDERDAF